MFSRTSSVESQLNAFISQMKNKRSFRRRTLVRSRSDSDIKYAVYAAAEAAGTSQYIKPDGEFNIKVIFKVCQQVFNGFSTPLIFDIVCFSHFI